MVSLERRNRVDKHQSITVIKKSHGHTFLLTVLIKFPSYSFIIQTTPFHDIHAAFQSEKLLMLLTVSVQMFNINII